MGAGHRTAGCPARRIPNTRSLLIGKFLSVLLIVEGQCLAINHSRKSADSATVDIDESRYRLGAYMMINNSVADDIQWKRGDLAADFHRQDYLPGG